MPSSSTSRREAGTRERERPAQGDLPGTPGEDDGFWDLYTSVNAGLVVRGNLVGDAHLAALMRQYGVTRISTHDRDFRRFEGLTVDDPFA